MPIVLLLFEGQRRANSRKSCSTRLRRLLSPLELNPSDRFQKVIELEPDDFQFDATYPDLSRPRTDDFVLIEILLGVGRSVKVKRKIVGDIIEALSVRGFDPEHVMIVFQEVPWENWSPGGGRIPHA